ncbi:MAG: hypothetical protein EXQ93_00735 [Alphaproteobacteria bacterium]|nr:hypothetical protein [Alphaproteobacteria bacterium]
MRPAVWIIVVVLGIGVAGLAWWAISLPRAAAPSQVAQAQIRAAAGVRPKGTATQLNVATTTNAGAALGNPDGLCTALALAGLPPPVPWRPSLANPSINECYSAGVPIGTGVPPSSISYSAHSRSLGRVEGLELVVRVGHASAMPEAIDRLSRAAIQLLGVLGTRAPDGLGRDIAAWRAAEYDLGLARLELQVSEGVTKDMRLLVIVP